MCLLYFDTLIPLNAEAQFFPATLFAVNTYSGLSQMSNMELFANIRNGIEALTIFLNSSTLDIWLGCKYIL